MKEMREKRGKEVKKWEIFRKKMKLKLVGIQKCSCEREYMKRKVKMLEDWTARNEWKATHNKNDWERETWGGSRMINERMWRSGGGKPEWGSELQSLLIESRPLEQSGRHCFSYESDLSHWVAWRVMSPSHGVNHSWFCYLLAYL